jgi:ferredoxin
MSAGQKAVIAANLCVGCGVCVDICPNQALEVSADGIAYLSKPDACDGSGGCVEACPVQAVTLK